MTRFPVTAAALLLSIGLTGADVGAHQWDPLKRVREKAEQLKKKIECAVNDPACIEKAKKEGAAPPQKPVAGAAPAAPANASRLNATFTSTPLAPYAQQSLLQTVVSDDGGRAAGVAMRGSRVVVVIDGQDGPPFDQIKPSAYTGDGPSRDILSGAAAFGPGGRRVAYLGVRAGQTFAVIDGKEGPPFQSIAMDTMAGDPHRRRNVFLFSDDGSRVAYVGMIPAAGNPPRLLQVVLDGTPGSRYAHIKEMIFAGTRHAYVATKADGKDVLVVDGKEQPFSFAGMKYLKGNKDGHIAFMGDRGDSWSVVVDGVEGKAHQRPDEDLEPTHNVVLAPTGKRVAYGVVRDRQPGPRVQLYLDGKVIRSAGSFYRILFSPDGTRIAGSFAESSQGQKAFVDDWTSLEYTGVVSAGETSSSQYSNMQFSPDSKRFAFIAANGSNAFAVVDGKESQGYLGIKDFRFAPAGQRYAFEARKRMPDGTIPWLVVIDGTDGPSLIEVARHSLTFSPDGSRVAYAGQVGFSSGITLIDGQEHKMAVVAFQPQAAKMILNWGFPLERWFVFSSDGKRLALVVGGIPSGVVVDGQPQASGHLFMLPRFSSDGKRFACIGWLNQKAVLVIDGKTAEIEGELYQAPNSLAFQDDGSVRFLVVKDNMLHRVVATPKSGTN